MNESKSFHFHATVTWTGNLGSGTSDYSAYARDHIISGAGKPDIAGSSDPAFRGDAARHTPEDLLVSALSACHMLWYLHLASDAGLHVMAYRDHAHGIMTIEPGSTGTGRFSSIHLQPAVTLPQGSDIARARRLHEAAHTRCFIANSVNFPVRCEPTFELL